MGSRRPLIVTLMAAALCMPHVAAPQSATAVLQPPSARNLFPVPLPRLDDLEIAVADQIREAQQKTVDAVARNGASRDAADAYGSLARVYHAYEFFESAEPAYVNATRLASGNSEWFHLLGVLDQQTGRLEDAAQALATARRLQPRDHAAAMHLGDVYLSLNRLLDAREQFQSLVETFPAVARRGLGDVALRERRFAEAIEHYRAVLDRVPQANAIHYSMAMAYRGMGRLEEAREHLQRRGPAGVYAADPLMIALQSIVRGERALVMQGRRAYEAGQFQAAADAFSRALDATPSSVAARVNLGSTLIVLDRDADAIPYLRDALRMAPEEAGLAETLIGALIRRGRADEAIAIWSRASPARIDDETVLVGISILLADGERFRDAIAVLDDAHRRFPDRVATATTLARLLASVPDLSLRDGARALELATAVNAAEPSPVHGETVALALAELGRCDEAMGWMTRAIASAEQGKNAAEAKRLSGEIAKYQRAMCRP